MKNSPSSRKQDLPVERPRSRMASLVNLIALVVALVILLIPTGCASNPPSTTPSGSTNATTAVTTAGTTAASKIFTLAELSQYNGQNGQPAYVAVNGVVYDVTNAPNWQNGGHQTHLAGKDLTQELGQSPHGSSILAGLPVVGTLKG
jgi:predicted heme/steroid binding protein